jgi:hypothetical protein
VGKIKSKPVVVQALTVLIHRKPRRMGQRLGCAAKMANPLIPSAKFVAQGS